MGLGYGKESEPCGNSVPMSMQRADTRAPADWRQEIRISTFYLQGLGQQLPNGNIFHFISQRALLSVGTVTRLSLLLSAAWTPFTLR